MNTLKFKILLSTVCFILTSSLFALDKNIISVPQSEKDALIALYNATAGINWTNTTQGNGIWPVNDPNAEVISWDEATNTGWYGVTVKNGHIISIVLNNNNLKGYLSDSIKNLPELTTLILGQNKLSGSITEGISELTKLTVLWLNSNEFTGYIPNSINRLLLLYDLRLDYNKLSGTIPSVITDLVKLKYLRLDSNSLAGVLPNDINKLKELTVLSVTKNEFVGSLPTSISQLTKLSQVHLSYNKFSGVLPSLLSNPSLHTLKIDNNRFKFIDFENEFNTYLNNITTFLYAPQSKVDVPNNSMIGLGMPYQLKMYEDDRYTANETYQWYKDGQVISGANSRIYTINSVTASDAGVYYCKSTHNTITIPSNSGKNLILQREPINLTVTEAAVEPTGYITFTTPKLCAGNDISFNFVFDSPNDGSVTYTYNWTFEDSDENIFTSTDVSPTFTTLAVGNVNITLEITGSDGGSSYNAYVFYVGDCKNCIYNNTQYNTVKNLFIALINHLQSQPSGTITQGYTCQQLLDLSPYITDTNPGIYDFYVDYRELRFSFNPGEPEKDVQLYFGFDAVFPFQDLLLGQYISSSDQTIVYAVDSVGRIYGPRDGDPYIKHINFCPTVTPTCTVTGNITTSNSIFCTSENTTFNFEFDLPNQSATYTYNWTFTDNGGNSTNSTAVTPTFSTVEFGLSTVFLTLTGSDGCIYNFEKSINFVDCSLCIYSNNQFEIVKNFFIELVNKLASLPAGTVTQGYNNFTELNNLAPYITDANPGIYNFSYSNGIMRFSFADHPFGVADVSLTIPQNELPIQNIFINNYTSPNELFYPKVQGVTGQMYYGDEVFIRHIDFCPGDGGEICERHIAIVVDESGSIDLTEARKIRSQLRSFILKQQQDNEVLGSGIRVSLIGLSDSDTDTRTNASIPNNGDNVILNEIITANNLGLYLNWINGYRTNRVSPNSDYWNSGLSKAAELNPDFVILITDGCQTSNAGQLQLTMQNFNNYVGGNSSNPHLFVIGIEDGFYVDSDTPPITSRKAVLSKEEDPNLNPELSRSSLSTARVSSFLRTSLKYLFNYTTTTDFPTMEKYSFVADYYGASDFNFLYDEPNYISNGLIAKSFYISDDEIVLVPPIVGMGCGNMIPLEGCNDCLNFKPEQGQKYIVSAWTKEEVNYQVTTYTNPYIELSFIDISGIVLSSIECYTSGDIIDGWQRIFKQIQIPEGTAYLQIALTNNSVSIPVYFDDIRIHPMDGSMKSFVYDPETFRLMAELDDNNYSTFYEYDNEGGLVRVKKETSRGIKTIQETRSGNVITE